MKLTPEQISQLIEKKFITDPSGLLIQFSMSTDWNLENPNGFYIFTVMISCGENFNLGMGDALNVRADKPEDFPVYVSEAFDMALIEAKKTLKHGVELFTNILHNLKK